MKTKLPPYTLKKKICTSSTTRSNRPDSFRGGSVSFQSTPAGHCLQNKHSLFPFGPNNVWLCERLRLPEGFVSCDARLVTHECSCVDDVISEKCVQMMSEPVFGHCQQHDEKRCCQLMSDSLQGLK